MLKIYVRQKFNGFRNKQYPQGALFLFFADSPILCIFTCLSIHIIFLFIANVKYIWLFFISSKPITEYSTICVPKVYFALIIAKNKHILTILLLSSHTKVSYKLGRAHLPFHKQYPLSLNTFNSYHFVLFFRLFTSHQSFLSDFLNVGYCLEDKFAWGH